MKSIIAFGDSNTWGLVPGSKSLERYSDDVRWTGVLQKKLNNARVIEEGLCGRTTVFEDEFRNGRRGISSLPVILESQYPIDVAIIMLGTNDCKKVYAASPYIIGRGIELCLDELEKCIDKDKILLVSPIHLGENVWKPEKDPEFDTESVEKSKNLKEVYFKIAKERGINFLAASDYIKADEKDDEHLNADGHKIFADVVFDKLKEMKAV